MKFEQIFVFTKFKKFCNILEEKDLLTIESAIIFDSCHLSQRHLIADKHYIKIWPLICISTTYIDDE